MGHPLAATITTPVTRRQATVCKPCECLLLCGKNRLLTRAARNGSLHRNERAATVTERYFPGITACLRARLVDAAERQAGRASLLRVEDDLAVGGELAIVAEIEHVLGADAGVALGHQVLG